MYTAPFLAPKNRSPLSLVFALLISMTGCQQSEEGQTDEKLYEHDHSKHEHGIINVNERWPDAAIPSIQIEVLPDSISGWNIKITTENFDFAAEKVSQGSTPNEGHAHLFVDKHKFSRIYGTWFHLKSLSPGKHEIRITLNANDHSLLGYQGKEISAVTNIEQN